MWTFWTAFVIASLLTLNGGFNGFFSLIDTLTNPEGLVPYSDNFEKYVYDPQYFIGSGRLGTGSVYESNNPDLRTKAGISNANPDTGIGEYDPPLLDLDGKPYPVFYQYGSGQDYSQTIVTFLQDLRGKKFEAQYRITTTGGTGSPPLVTISSNCGQKILANTQDSGASFSGTIRIVSNNLDDSMYAFLVSNNQICKGTLQPGEKLTVGITAKGENGATISIHHLRWLFPFQCRAEGMDLAFEDFQSGQTVTLTGSTQRWPKALCPELSPLLINQSAGGVQPLPELLTLLATPPKGSKPYVVPSNCNSDNTGGCVLRLAYWIPKDLTLPTACVDTTLQRAFNLNTKECDDIINIRNFCTKGIIFNNECLTPTDVKAKFNCTGTLDLTGPVPVCSDSKTKTGIAAYCKPSTGGYDPITGKCPDGKPPYTTYEEACKADGGTPNGEQCFKETAITFEDETGTTIGTGIANPGGNVRITSGTTVTANQCESATSKETCAIRTTTEDLEPWYEKKFHLNDIILGIKLKAVLLAISLLTLIWIGLIKKALLK